MMDKRRTLPKTAEHEKSDPHVLTAGLAAIVPKATTSTPRRRFPIEDVPEGLRKDIAELRVRLKVNPPEEISIKVFLLEELQGILVDSAFDPPAHLLRVLQAIKEDYLAYLPEKEDTTENENGDW